VLFLAPRREGDTMSDIEFVVRFNGLALDDSLRAKLNREIQALTLREISLTDLAPNGNLRIQIGPLVNGIVIERR
jgi:hypothetical protein